MPALSWPGYTHANRCGGVLESLLFRRINHVVIHKKEPGGPGSEVLKTALGNRDGPGEDHLAVFDGDHDRLLAAVAQDLQ